MVELCYFLRSWIMRSCSNIFCQALDQRSQMYFLALCNWEDLLLNYCQSQAIRFLDVLIQYFSCCSLRSYSSLFFNTSNLMFYFNQLIILRCSVILYLSVPFSEFIVVIRSSNILMVFSFETISSSINAFSIFLRQNSRIWSLSYFICFAFQFTVFQVYQAFILYFITSIFRLFQVSSAIFLEASLSRSRYLLRMESAPPPIVRVYLASSMKMSSSLKPIFDFR